MDVLIACEYSARVRDAFRARGHNAWSVDILPTEGDPRWHFQDDALAVARRYQWDLMIAFPPCTDLSAIGAASWAVKQADGRQQRAAQFFTNLYRTPIRRVAIENPVGWMNRNWRKPDQIIHPYHFGDPWTKRRRTVHTQLVTIPTTRTLAGHAGEDLRGMG